MTCRESHNRFRCEHMRLCALGRMRTMAFALLALVTLLLPLGLRAYAAEEATPAPAAAVTPSPVPEAEKTATPEPEETPTPLTFKAPAVAPETAANVYGTNVPGLRMEVFDVDGSHFKFTLYGIGELLSFMQEQLKGEDINYSFRYSLRMLAVREVNLKGKITYRQPKRGEDVRITKISSELHCKELSYKSKHPRVEADKLSWLLTMKKWFGFDLSKVSGFEFTIYNAYDTRQKIVYNFDTDAVATDTLLHTSLRKGGVLRVQVHDKNSITITITDPKLRDGYKNSPDEPGAIDPFWHVQAIINAKGWVEARIEGKDGQDIHNMDYYAGEYHRLKDDSNQYNATSAEVPVKSYKIDGNDVMMSLTVPSGAGLNLKYLEQIAVDMNNGTVLKNNIYNVY